VTARLVSVIVGGAPAAWIAAGFSTDANGWIPFANGALEFTGEGSGLLGLRVDGAADLPGTLEGIPLTSGVAASPIEHPNGCFELDHVVIVTPALERTSDSVAAALGMERRRMRDTATARQAFHRFDRHGCILELVESERLAEPRLFGVVINTPDLDAVVERLGPDVIGTPKHAVQPGRRIATLRAAAGLGAAVALMTREVASRA
jgi:hypothetical protein